MQKRQQAPGALELVRAFLNTADFEQGTDALADAASFGSWLELQRLAPSSARITQADLDRAIDVREALRSLVLAHNGLATSTDPGAVLDEAAGRAKLRLHFDGTGRSWLEPEAAGVTGALGRMLAIVHGAIGDGSWQQLKACRLDSCQWAFYDHTKNHSGTWCTMEVCGNRAKARAYRERRGARA